MTTESGPDADLRAFVRAARSFCEFVETASTASNIAEHLNTARRLLADLIATGSALPLVDPTTDEILPRKDAPPNWPGFGSHEFYWETFDPYVDDERVAGSLSDDFLDIYCDLKPGLVAFDDGQELDATWEWRFGFDRHWGDHAVDALRALQRACTATAERHPDSASRERPRVLIQTGGLVENTEISIGIHGPDVQPLAISALLGVEATSQHCAGEPRKSGPPWSEGAWLFAVEGKAPRGPEDIAEEFLRALPPPDTASWATLRSKHRLLVKVAVFLSGLNRGYAMSDGVLRRLARFSGSIDFDIYAD